MLFRSSDASVSRLERECSVLRFDLGGQLSEPNEIPARILVILQGQARLVGRHNGRLTTVGKFGPGSVIGAASLLCGNPCENVIASDEVIACAISDEQWTQLYGEEESFRLWCDKQLWPHAKQRMGPHGHQHHHLRLQFPSEEEAK